MHASHSLLFQSVRQRSKPLRRTEDLKPLVDEIARSRIVMLGEASHGSHEFYEWRQEISRMLIEDHGFDFIAVEGDWPPCWEFNRWIRGETEGDADEMLHHFQRWPTWMWANTEVRKFAEWMREHNSRKDEDHQIGFYGLDVYSLFESMDSVLHKLQRLDPLLAKKARTRYECFERFRHDEREYAKSLLKFPEGCEREAIATLQELLNRRLQDFDIEQNSRVVANAEKYYRAMMLADQDSWNVRDEHMTDTLEHLLDRAGPDSKAIVWAHNTHIGDYRATDMIIQGQVNLGGLARERWGAEQVKLVGFGTYRGQVTASHAWDGPIETMDVPPGRPGSIESSFHEVARAMNENSFFLSLKHEEFQSGPLTQAHGHRAIGVVYHPSHERFGNYVPTLLADRYDAFVFVDRTTALHPLHQGFIRSEIPETWPQGF